MDLILPRAKAASHVRLIWILGFILLGAALRIAHITQPMRADESTTFLNYASLPLSQAIANYSDVNNHLLHTLLLNLGLPIFGETEPGIRIWVLLSGILTLPVTYWAARHYLPWHAALMALALVAVSPPLILYSSNARGYILQTLILTIMLGLLPRLRHSRSPALWVTFAMLAALGFYAVPSFAFAMGGISLWLGLSILVGQRGPERWRSLAVLAAALLLGALLTLLLYTPVFLYGINPADSPHLSRFNENWPNRWPLIPERIVLGLAQGVPDYLIALGGLGVLLSILRPRQTMRVAIPLALAMLLYITVQLMLQRVAPQPRTWSLLGPFFAICASAGLAYLLRRWPRLLPALSLVYALGMSVHILRTNIVVRIFETGRVENVQEIAEALTGILQADDLLLVRNPTHDTVRYYWRRLGGDLEQIWGFDRVRREGLHPEAYAHIYALTSLYDERLIGQDLRMEAQFADWLVAVHPVDFPRERLRRLDFSPMPQDRTLRYDFEDGPGDFAFTQDLAAQIARMDGEHVLRLGGADWSTLALIPSSRWHDLTLSGRLRIEASTPGLEQDFYIGFRSLPNVGRYEAALKAGGFLQVRGNHDEEPLRFVRAPLNSGEWHAFSLTIAGDQFAWEVAGVRLELRDERFPTGSLLLVTAPGAEVWLDDLVIELAAPLSSTIPAPDSDG